MTYSMFSKMILFIPIFFGVPAYAADSLENPFPGNTSSQKPQIRGIHLKSNDGDYGLKKAKFQVIRKSTRESNCDHVLEEGKLKRTSSFPPNDFLPPMHDIVIPWNARPFKGEPTEKDSKVHPTAIQIGDILRIQGKAKAWKRATSPVTFSFQEDSTIGCSLNLEIKEKEGKTVLVVKVSPHLYKENTEK